jgi:eukaryotic-like serine/threonine-protein kinase
MGGDVVEAPERVGRYEIVLPIAKGGMATVYLARAEGHGGFDRYVALKLTLPHLRSDPEFSAVLLDEAKLVAHIRHTNVVPVIDVAQDTLGVFLVMDYVAGDTLAGLMRTAAGLGAPLPAAVSLRILVDALEGLHAAHEHGDEDGYPLHLVHRDFSPQNILVGTDGVARLTDFGIAKAASRASSTAAGLIKGKMSYVSPEQARGLPLDRRCDLWAAGVIAWEIMCGRKLSTPNDPRSLVATVKRAPPLIRTVVPDAPAAIEAVIASVLKLDPNERPATAQQLARELTAAARGAGMFAETHEVAEHVTRLAGPLLAERKARLATARRLRIGSVPDGIATTIGLPSPVESATRLALAEPKASLPEADIAITVAEDSVPPPPLAPAVATSDANTTTRGVEASAEPRTSGYEDSAVTPGLASRIPRVALLAGSAGLVVLIGIIALTLKLAAGRDAEANADGASASASASAAASGSASATLPSSAVIAPPATVAAPPPEKAEEIAPAQFLALSTNAPVAEVRVGDRVVDMVLAAPNVNVELEPEETQHALVLTLKSADGRVATKTLARGELEAKIAFPAARAPGPAPAPPRTQPQPQTRNGKPPRR